MRGLVFPNLVILISICTSFASKMPFERLNCQQSDDLEVVESQLKSFIESLIKSFAEVGDDDEKHDQAVSPKS